MKIIRKLGLYYQTLKYLRAKQIFYQLWSRVNRRFPEHRIKAVSEIKGTPLSFSPFIIKPESLTDNTFTLLNRSKDYHSAHSINWDDPVFGKLWTYNLNYFDFLLQPVIETGKAMELIEIFIEKYPGLTNAKEPYTISLRGNNWIKWVSRNKINDERFLSLLNTSLYNQYQRLYSNIEYHLMGNHLLENAFSLLYGAFYFSDDSFYKKANKLLCNELNEQILNDGAHFELSPMYHQMMLDRILDCVNLLQNNSLFPKQNGLLSLLQTKASVMTGWLHTMTFSNGDIPLVNDASKGISPSSADLFIYAGRLKIDHQIEALSDSGYRTFSGKNFELLVDYGIPGPDYIPGHAHADIFNFVLYVNGTPFITDAGISTYDAGEIRTRERSTAAHNTVQVNGREQSDMWGSFRMGRRAKTFIIYETNQNISGYHTGFKPNIHQREFSISKKNLIITDSISGPDHSAVAYLHFAPSVRLQILENAILSDHCKINIPEALQIRLEQYEYAAGFNIRVEASLVKIVFNKSLQTIFEFLNL